MTSVLFTGIDAKSTPFCSAFVYLVAEARKYSKS